MKNLKKHLFLLILFPILLTSSCSKEDRIDPDLTTYNMVLVEGGTFTMGCTGEQGDDCWDDEKPAHSVTLSDFYIGKYEVTQKEWTDIMGQNPSDFSDCDQCPVEEVSWEDIQEFLAKLNKKTGNNFRLPTEAEWEYAARGGNQSGNTKYAGSNEITLVAWWFEVNTDHRTHPVGGKAPNELGIYDMSGNVGEWCSDWFGDYISDAQSNPQGPSSGLGRVFRGGSWGSFDWGCRVSDRYYFLPFTRTFSTGFRLAQD